MTFKELAATAEAAHACWRAAMNASEKAWTAYKNAADYSPDTPEHTAWVQAKLRVESTWAAKVRAEKEKPE